MPMHRHSGTQTTVLRIMIACSASRYESARLAIVTSPSFSGERITDRSHPAVSAKPPAKRTTFADCSIVLRSGISELRTADSIVSIIASRAKVQS